MAKKHSSEAFYALDDPLEATVFQCWSGLGHQENRTHPEEKAEVSTMLVGILPVSERVGGTLFDTYVSTPEMLNSSESKDYPFGNIKTPALVISAVDDPFALHKNARALADRIPNSRLLAIPDGGHMLLGHNEEVKTKITHFLHNNVALLNNSQ